MEEISNGKIMGSKQSVFLYSYKEACPKHQREFLSITLSSLGRALNCNSCQLYFAFPTVQSFQNQTEQQINSLSSICSLTNQILENRNSGILKHQNNAIDGNAPIVFSNKAHFSSFLVENSITLENSCSTYALFTNTIVSKIDGILVLSDEKPIPFSQENINLAQLTLADICSAISHLTPEFTSSPDICLLQRIIDLIPQSIYLKNTEGKYIMVNKSFASLYEQAPKALVGKTQAEIHTNKEEVEQYTKDDIDVLNEKRSKYNPEEKFTDIYGNKLYFQTLKVPFSLKGRNMDSLMGISIDITEQMITTEALIESQQSLEEAQRISHIGNFNRNILTGKVFWSAQVYKIFGISAEKATSDYNSILSIIHPDDRENRQKCIDLAIKSHTNYQCEYRIMHADGTFVDIFEKAEILRDEQGKIANIIGTIQDISERKEFEKELLIAKRKAEEADELKSALLSTFSHNARYPLNSILGFTELLINPKIDESKKSKFVQIINNSGKSLINLIDNIIDISRIETGQFQLSENDCDINKTLYDALSDVNKEKDELKKNHIEISLDDFIQRDMFVKTDANRLKTVVYNLLQNALKYTEKGTIRFGYTLEGNNGSRTLKFYVKDAGVGVLDAQIEKIFDGKNQLDNIRNNNKDSSGLGLVIAKKVIELLGGKIWIESIVGCGSTFYFTIPFKPIEKVNTVRNRGVQPYNWEDKVILIAEDDDDNYRFLKEILIQTKAHIIRASNGLESLEFVKEQQENLDLILMDIKMPQMDGYEATKKINEFHYNIPIIAQTAFADLEEKEKSFKAGCVAHISKPIQVNELLLTIEKFI